MPRGLVVDYGGVLTTPLARTMTRWARTDGVDYADFAELMRRWLTPDAGASPVHDLETGRLSVEEFERQLAAELPRPDGSAVPAAGLIRRMLGGFAPAPEMVAVVAKAKADGTRTALLSNSWGLDYPRAGWDELFDAVVISGEVGMRKPEPAIYAHTARLLDLPAEQCVFVDDLLPNVCGAAAAGMVAVHHTGIDTTLAELAVLFGRPMR